jgi:hypothetical protein
MLHSARAIETAPHGPAEERPFLLWCPEQGGWQTGVWFKGQWIAQEPFSPDSLDGNSDPLMSNFASRRKGNLGVRDTLGRS